MNVYRDAVPRLLTATLAPRAWLAALVAALMFTPGEVGVAQTPATREDARLLPYIKPGQLIDIGGRRINLYCTGAGGPTVVLMAGFSSWSPVWYKVQPVVAQKTRVCTFDRAAYGFSDPAPKPQILSDVVDDLHGALKAGAVPRPYVLVGHSLGGIEARLYAERWPKEIAGMVLVDTSPAAEGLIDEEQPGFDEVTGRESLPADLLRCAALAAHGPLAYKQCSPELPSDTPSAFRKAFPKFFTPDYFIDRVALFASIYTHRYDSVDHQNLGAMPLVVLSAEHTWDYTEPAGVRFEQAYEPVWIAMHEALAHLSSRGVHHVVKDSPHEIQLDKPEAVIDAVDWVLNQIRTESRY